MSEIKDGGPAFPATSWTKDGEFLGENQGMTLRDYFMATAPITLQQAREVCGYCDHAEGWSDAKRAAAMAVLAVMRVEYAEAMLKAREAKP